MTHVVLGPGESPGLVDYLHRLTGLDHRAVVRLQASSSVLGVWSGPPFEAVALRPVALAEPAAFDLTVSARRLLDRLVDGETLELPATVPGPSWVGLLPPRSGWEERARGQVGYVREAVATAKHFFRQRAEGVAERRVLDSIAADVWERACVGEVPVRAAHAAEVLGLLGPADGEVVAWSAPGWVRLSAPGGSVAVRREPVPGLSLVFP